MNRPVRRRLPRTGSDRGAPRRVFWEVVDAIQERNKRLTPEAVQKLADEAVADARADRCSPKIKETVHIEDETPPPIPRPIAADAR